MAGFSGRITQAMSGNLPDRKLIALSAIRFGDQVPGEVKRSWPRVTKFGGQTL